MSRSKLKNLIILILLLVNGFLLALVVPTRLSDLRQQQQARQALSEIYRQADVGLDAADIPETKLLYAMDQPLSLDPLAAAEVLLGRQLLTTDTQTGIHVSSPLGQADFSFDGRMSADLTDQTVHADPEAYTRQLLGKLSLSPQALTRSTPYPGAETYTATFAVSGMPLFSHDLTFRYLNGRLAAVSGILPSTARPVRSGTEPCVSAEDALVTFLSRRLDMGWMGNRIHSVVQGCNAHFDTAQNLLHLQPVWKISTDAGDYLVDGLTCSVTAVE